MEWLTPRTLALAVSAFLLLVGFFAWRSSRKAPRTDNTTLLREPGSGGRVVSAKATALATATASVSLAARATIISLRLRLAWMV